MREEAENYLKKEMYELIKKDSTLFDFVQKGSLDGMWYWNLENIEDEWMSPRFWEVLGYDPKDKKHKSSEWQDIIFEDDLKETTKNLELHLQNPNHLYDQIVRYRHKNGTIVWIRCRGVAIRDAKGKAIRMIGAHVNISNEQIQIQKLKTLTKMTESLITGIEKEIDYQKLTDNLLDISDAKFAAFNLYTEDGKYYRTKAIAGNKGTIKKAMSITGIKFDKKKWIHDPIRADKIKDKVVTRFPTLHDLAGDTIPKSICTLLTKSFGLREAVLIKISKDNVMIGDFTLFMEKNTTFDKDSVVELYANQLALVLTNVLVTKKLKENEQRFRVTVQSLDEGVVIHAPDGSIIDFNNRALEIIGISKTQLLDKKGLDSTLKFVDEYEKPLLQENYPINRVLANHQRINHLTIGIVQSKNNEIVWAQIKGAPTFDLHGNIKEVVISYFDITHLKNSNKRLVESEQRFKILHNASFGGIAVHEKGHILECNQGLSDITGYSMKELVGMNGLLLVAPDYRDSVMEKIAADYEKPYEVLGVRKNGEIYSLKIEARNLIYDGKKIRVVEFRDITELKKQKELQKQSEEQYRLLSSEMQLGLSLSEIICDDNGNPIDFRFISVNKSWEKVMGVKREDIIGKTVLEVFPNTEKAWIDFYGEVALTGNSSKIEQYSSELNKYLSMSVYSPKKGLFAAVVEDVTEKKKQEELLNYSQKHDKLTGLPNRNYYDEKLIELDMKENFPLGIIMMDINGLKLINDSFGQEAGNTVLKQFATILSEEKREVDFITRTSGDEFIMLSPKTSTEEILQFKKRLLDKISKQRINNIEYSIALGYEIKETQNQDIYEIVTEAENAMYKNKIVYGQGTRSEAIESVFSTLTNKYAYEKTHSEGVAKYSRLIGEHLNLREDELDELELAGRLHDIGKIAISDDIIMKPGKLNDEEWKKIKDHTVIGYQILRAADKYSNLAEFAMSHHERMDGKGYPNGLMGKDIPLFARIICVADAYEAMTSDRTYRKAMSKEVAIDELKTYAGTQFDSEIVDVFIRAILIKENAF